MSASEEILNFIEYNSPILNEIKNSDENLANAIADVFVNLTEEFTSIGTVPIPATVSMYVPETFLNEDLKRLSKAWQEFRKLEKVTPEWAKSTGQYKGENFENLFYIFEGASNKQLIKEELYNDPKFNSFVIELNKAVRAYNKDVRNKPYVNPDLVKNKPLSENILNNAWYEYWTAKSPKAKESWAKGYGAKTVSGHSVYDEAKRIASQDLLNPAINPEVDSSLEPEFREYVKALIKATENYGKRQTSSTPPPTPEPSKPLTETKWSKMTLEELNEELEGSLELKQVLEDTDEQNTAEYEDNEQEILEIRYELNNRENE